MLQQREPRRNRTYNPQTDPNRRSAVGRGSVVGVVARCRRGLSAAFGLFRDQGVKISSSRARVASRATMKDMGSTRKLTAFIRREGDGYVSLCPELDVASQGPIVEQARANVIEALELFLEAADQNEVDRRLASEVFISPVEVAVG